MRQARVLDSPRDKESSHLSNALEVILWTLMTASLLVLVGGVFTSPQYNGRWLRIFFAVQAVSIPPLLLNRRGFLKLSSVWLVAALWVVVSGVVLTGGGLATRGSFAYVIIVFIAGFLLGPRAGIFTSLLCILTAAGVAISEAAGLTSARLQYSPAALWINLTLFIVIMMSLQYLASRTIRDALQQTKRELEERKHAEERVNLLQVITMDVAAARDFPAALEVVLRRVCEMTGWELGQAWVANQEATAFDCCHAWFATIAGTEEFRQISTESSMLPGVGLPGRIWVSRQPAWVRDVTLDPNFPRAEAARKNGLKAALGVPILAGDEVIAVLEFYLSEARDEDERMVRVISAVAAQIGLVMGRKRAEEELRRTSERLQIATKAASIGIWDWDIVNNEVVWDDAMFRIYGISKEDFRGAYETWEKSLAPEDLARATAGVQVALSGEREFAAEFRIVWPDGSVHYTHAASQTYRNELGRAVRMIGVNYDITALKEAEAALRALSESLRRAKEEEGIRIARELHDELGSALTSLKWNLLRLDQNKAAGHGMDANTSEKIAEMVGLVDSTINTVRRISSELRPGVVDDLGLVSAIEWHAQQFEDNTGIVCRFDSNVEDVELDRQQATTVFRIFQEAVTNILRHAQATRVIILIEEEEGEFVLEVRDNGRGISPAEQLGLRSLGLLGMRERAHSVGGTVEINGTAGKGTVVTVRLPSGTASANGNHDRTLDYPASPVEASPRKEKS